MKNYFSTKLVNQIEKLSSSSEIKRRRYPQILNKNFKVPDKGRFFHRLRQREEEGIPHLMVSS